MHFMHPTDASLRPCAQAWSGACDAYIRTHPCVYAPDTEYSPGTVNRPNAMLSEAISERYGSGYGVAVRGIALQGGAAGSRSRTGAAEELRSRPAPRSSPTPPRSIIVSQIRSLNPAFPCIAFRIKASPFLPMPLFERSHSINAPLAASAGARAAAPAAPRRLLLRLRNQREHATGHQQGKRRLRVKFWILGELTQYSSARL